LIKVEQPKLYEEFEKFGLELVSRGFLAHLELKPTLMDQIKEAQKGHESIEGIKQRMDREEVSGFKIDDKGVLWYNGHICVPTIDDLKKGSTRHTLFHSPRRNQDVSRSQGDILVAWHEA
jgi:hypothetical protein